MISLFRSTRRLLIKKKKIGRYLLYATGEIFLIVIGILIALGINNWNQNRQAREREKFYLEGLRSEFESSKIKLQNLMEVNRLNYEESKKIAKYLTTSEKLPPEEELSKALYNSFSYEIDYNPNNSLLNELINSGRLEDLSNEELRSHLTSWESFIQSIHRQEAALREQRESVVRLFRNGNGSISSILDDAGVLEEIGLPANPDTPGNLAIVRSPEFENNLLLFILTGINTETSHYQPLLHEINSILDLIDRELRDS
ncbi:DUF6090 family protein [Salinimicrobium soli]|uniref:DUF6090 family protein n=1 Tax=Salinimicrobium soli TaxID=1254399 RepID=UPI003AAD2F45